MTAKLVDDSGKEIDIYSEKGIKELAMLWLKTSAQNKIMYEPTWLGVPVIQFPTDLLMMQELIWKLRPDVIVETGFAHGGSAIFYSSLLELMGKGRVISIEVEVRKYNEVAIKSHPMSKRITIIEGSSIAKETLDKVKQQIGVSKNILVCLDSNHSYEHVKQEIALYSSLVPAGGYLVVMDGAQKYVHDIPRGNTEWKTDNPLEAINEFIEGNEDWEIDTYYNRMYVTSNPDGFLRRKECDGNAGVAK